MTTEKSEARYLRHSANWSGIVRLAVFFPLARFNLPVDIIGDPLARRPVDDQLVQRGHLGRTVRADKVLFEQVGLNAILAVGRPATRRFDSVAEDPIVDWANDAWVFCRPFANFGLGEAFRLDGLPLP